MEGHTFPASLLITEDDNTEEYNEEGKGWIIGVFSLTFLNSLLVVDWFENKKRAEVISICLCWFFWLNLLVFLLKFVILQLDRTRSENSCFKQAES